MNRAITRSRINQLRALVEQTSNAIAYARSERVGKTEHVIEVQRQIEHLQETMLRAQAMLNRLQLEELEFNSQ